VAYCALDDIKAQITEAELIELTDDAAAGSVDEAVVARAIDDAQAEVDTYCRGLYPVPLDPVPGRVRAVSVDVAIYNLYKRRGHSMEQDNPRRMAYRDAVAWLDRLARGVATLGTEAPAQAAADLPKASTSKEDRIFTTGRSSDGSSGTLDNY
jgi:phage gp36-like protein